MEQRRKHAPAWLKIWHSALQFGHLFAKGDTREAAIRAMVVALKEVKIRGEIRTIVDYAVEMIQSADFVTNNIHTGWLDARIAQHVRAQGVSCTRPLCLVTRDHRCGACLRSW